MFSFRPLVSCVVPVYNAEKYLDQGITSLLSQTYDNIEIILIDDASTDKSWDICKKYAEENNNVYAFRNTVNTGAPLRSRERGIRESKGEWITFMDCDDYVKPEYIEHLVEATHNGKYDIAVTGHIRLYPNGSTENFLWKNYSQTTKERLLTFYKHFFIDQDFWTDPADTVGQNLIRASIAKVTDLSKYPNTVWGEDSLMALVFLANSKNGINFVDHHDFYWRQREGSGSHGGFSTTADRPSLYRACYEIFNNKRLLPTVSLIIPIYNVERYIKDCLESVLSQTYPNLEIILVDDNTPDESGRIADNYADKDNRIQVIHKPKNEGLNKARATGFRVATGEYTMFVDSDDLLVKDCVETTLSTLLRNEADFVRFSMKSFKDGKDLTKKLSKALDNVKEIVLEGKKHLYMTQFDPGRELEDLSIISMTVWGALYTKRLVDNVSWDDANFRVYEDNIWTLRLLENASKGVFVSYIGYCYRYDNTITDVLSKRLTGNDFNGKPIGYMEYWNYVWDEYRRYNKKYKLGASEVIENTINHLYVFRANHLTQANLWGVEGNSDYLQETLKRYCKKLEESQRSLELKNIHIRDLESENARIKNELTTKSTELNSYLSIKRSVRLTLGNIKRRIMRGKGN